MELFIFTKHLNLRIVSVTCAASCGNYMKYVNFLSLPRKARLWISTFCFFTTRAKKPQSIYTSALTR